jgi:hypothetical protein
MRYIRTKDHRRRRLTLYQVASRHRARAIHVSDPYLSTEEWLTVMHDYSGVYHWPPCLDRRRRTMIAAMWDEVQP